VRARSPPWWRGRRRSAGVDGVQHGQPGVVDRPGGIVDRRRGVVLGPGGIAAGRVGVELVGSLVDPRLEVVHLGGGVGLHLGPLAAAVGRGRTGVLPGLGGLLVHLHLGLVDALAELVTGLRHGLLGRGLGVGGRMAQEFGDHPDAAASRIRWLRQLAQTTGSGR
jgi:hypothetical protein